MEDKAIQTEDPVVENFDVDKICLEIYSATSTKELNTNDLDIISKLPIDKRKLVRSRYSWIFKRDLKKSLNIRHGKKFKGLINSLFKNEYENMCEQLKKASKTQDVKTIIEILLPLSTEQMDDLKEHYFEKYGYYLKDRMRRLKLNHTSSLILLLLTQKRQMNVDRHLALIQSKDIRSNDGKTEGIDMKAFNECIARESFEQLLLIFEKFETFNNVSIEDAIRKFCEPNIVPNYIKIVNFIRDQKVYFVNRLYEVLRSPNINEQTLIRIIVCQSENDLAKIRDTYKGLIKENLSEGLQSTNLASKHALSNLITFATGAVQHG